MSDLTCDYHPQREAVEKCHECQRLICLADKQVFNPRNSFGSFRTSGLYCPKCYYERVKRSNSPFSARLAGAISFIIILFFGGFILLFNVVLQIESSFLSYFFFGFIVLSVVMIWLAYFLTNSFAGNKYDIKQAKNAMEQLVQTQISQPRTPQDGSAKLFNEDKTFCMNCGTENMASKVFCSKCGDELHAVK